MMTEDPSIDPRPGFPRLYGLIRRACESLGHPGPVGADHNIVFWHGDLPEAVGSLIEDSGLSVEVRQVPYPHDVLDAAVRGMFTRNGINSAGPGRDCASINATVRPGTSVIDKTEASRPVPVPGFAEPIPVSVSEREDAVGL